jgi:lipopolysaccharide export system protein LptC
VNTRNLVITVMLILLAGLSGWLQNISEKSVSAQVSQKGENRVDFFFEDSQITTMGPDGHLKNLLVSEKITHYSADDTTEILKPDMLLYKKDESPWHVTADRGWVSADGEHIFLKGAVTVDRSASAGNEAMNLSTSELRIRPKDQYAESDTQVTLKGRNYRATSVGMRVYLKQGKIQLLSQVRGHYE